MTEEINCWQQFWGKFRCYPMRKQEVILLAVKTYPQNYFVAFETFTLMYNPEANALLSFFIY